MKPPVDLLELYGNDLAELIRGADMLLASAPPHMTPRNAKEREAYKRIRAALARLKGGAA
ncbi:hypothetical protein [Thermomonas sp.]|uniref:hypothetical protein n=1 Tax=Thermomonas sp. TaxID=1971895 RepID=UPI0035AFEA3D